MRELPMTDNAPTGDIFHKDGFVRVVRDINAIHVDDAQAAVAQMSAPASTDPSLQIMQYCTSCIN
jgi:hypothetical protein